MKLTWIRRSVPTLVMRLMPQDRGSVTVEMAVIIGIVLLVAAVILGPRVVQLVQSLMSKWPLQ
jgi:hypothetical protein